MPKSGSELVQEALDELMHSRYDPIKAHEYYVRTRKLKGRKKGSQEPAKVIPIGGKRNQKARTPRHPHGVPPALEARIHHLEARLNELRDHLRKLLANKSNKSSHKSKHVTTQDKQKRAAASKKYRQTHKTQIANLRKSKAHGGHKGHGGGGGGGSSVSSMTETELRAAIKKTSANLHAAVAKARTAANR